MNNAKWIVFGFCFLTVMAGLGVWWVECKIAQVTNVVDGAVESVQETVNAPIDALANAQSGLVDSLNAAVNSPAGDAWFAATDAIDVFLWGPKERR